MFNAAERDGCAWEGQQTKAHITWRCVLYNAFSVLATAPAAPSAPYREEGSGALSRHADAFVRFDERQRQWGRCSGDWTAIAVGSSWSGCVCYRQQ
jgi:hypothetical protein